jgi:hypothetical protein
MVIPGSAWHLDGALPPVFVAEVVRAMHVSPTHPAPARDFPQKRNGTPGRYPPEREET